MSIAAYQQTIAETEDPRRIEHRVFMKITLELEKHAAVRTTSEGLKTALLRNMQLWNALRSDLLDEANELPDALKAGLISLSFSVDRHTTRVLAGDGDAGLLIDINRAVMRGLQGAPSAAPMEVAHGA